MKTHGKAVLGCVLAACLSSAAIAGPATMKDLVGKKICWVVTASNRAVRWESPVTSTYSAGGRYYDTLRGAGTFTLTASGFHAATAKGSLDSQIEKLSDGSFKSTEVANGHETFVATGQYCQ
jgi:hypothetical protein